MSFEGVLPGEFRAAQEALAARVVAADVVKVHPPAVVVLEHFAALVTHHLLIS